MYFDKAGPHNTNATLKAAYDFTWEQQAGCVVVASTSGRTGLAAARLGAQRRIPTIVVSHNTGFKEVGIQQMDPELRDQILETGAKLHTGTLALRGIGSAIRSKSGYSEEELIANTLRIFGQGLKVCIEMAAMITDAGLIPVKDSVFVAGTGTGADTAALIHPAPSNQFFRIRVRRIIAKPEDF